MPESDESSNEHACRLEKLALARSKLVQRFRQTPWRLETTNLTKTNVFFLSEMPTMEHAGGDVRPGAASEMEPRTVIRSLTGSKS